MYCFSGGDFICLCSFKKETKPADFYFVVYSKEITQKNDNYKQTQRNKEKITFLKEMPMWYAAVLR